MTNTKKQLINAVTIMGLLGSAFFIIYGIKMQIFTSQTALEQFMKSAGVFAPSLFVTFQAVQVVIPILPGGIGCLAGVIIFGPVKGFIYNYSGICIGSVIAFLLAKNYGSGFVRSVFNEKTYQKYASWLQKGSNFDKWFALAILSPVAPDDYLCYLAGLTEMRVKKFTLIILACKPIGIAAYSFGINLIYTSLLSIFH